MADQEGVMSVSGLSRIKETLASMPLSLKLTLLTLITLLPRVVASLQPKIITFDGTLYIKMAKLFSEGNYTGISNTSFNLYPLMIFIVQKVVGDWELSGLLISITLGTFTVIPIFLLGRSLYNEKIGWLSALFYITLPDFLRFDSQVLRDPIAWFFIAITLWLVWEGLQKKRMVLLGLASITSWLGAATRIEVLVLFIALAVYAAFRKGLGISAKRRVLNVGILLLLFPILLSPVFFSMKKFSSPKAFKEMVTSPFYFIKDKTRLIIRPLDPIDAMGRKTYDSLPQLSQNSLELASRHRIVLAISEVIYKFIKSANLLIILIPLGIWRRKKEGFESSDWYLLYTFTALFCMSVLYTRHNYYFSTRHGLTLVLPCIFLAGDGLYFINEILSKGFDRFTSRWIVIKRYLFHLITFFFMIIFLVYGISFKKDDKYFQKEIGLWLKEKGYQDALIMGPKRFIRIAFYADGTFLEMPDSWERVAKSIRKDGVKIVVIDTCTIDQDCPDFLHNGIQAGLSPLQKLKGKGEKCPIEIYEVH
jgi:hypothetical protein